MEGGEHFPSGASPNGDRGSPSLADPDDLRRAGIPCAVWAALAAAAEQACVDCSRSVPALRGREHELSKALLEGVRRATSGYELCAAAKSHLPAAAAVRLTRRGFLTNSEHLRRGEPAALLRVLDALECVEAALESVGENQSVARQLSGPEALDLAVSTAHDMRSPLGAILFLADLLRRGPQSDPNAVRRQAGLMYNAALGLSLLTNDIIDFGRGSTHLAAGPRIPFSVAEVVESVYDIILPLAEEQQLELRVRRDGESGRLGHPTALNRVLLNLTTNALKYTEQGSVEIAVRDTGPDRVEFSVIDTGPGVANGLRAQLFEAVRWVSDSGEYAISSTGLGLVICRRLLAELRSELQVETAVGRGTRFYFELHLPLASQ